jgi:hypothetical protein
MFQGARTFQIEILLLRSIFGWEGFGKFVSESEHDSLEHGWTIWTFKVRSVQVLGMGVKFWV